MPAIPTFPETRIPGFAPWGLDLVPDYRVDSLTGAEDETWRHDPDPTKGWFAWRDAVKAVVVEIQERCERDMRYREEILAQCRVDPAFFVAVWLVVEEPRPDAEDDNVAEYGHDMLKNFIPYAYQVRLLQLALEVASSPLRWHVYISKARGIGVSYIMMAFALWWWLFRPGRSRVLSAKQDLVDRTHDLDSLFGKVDLFIVHLPKWLVPDGYSVLDKKWRQQGMFKHPVNRNAQITGEATTGNSVRGGRATFVMNDECAFQENYTETKATVSGSCKHCFDWSSESYVKGRQWQNAWKSAKSEGNQRTQMGLRPVATVVELDWPLNPYQDRRWYDEEFAIYAAQGNADAFAVEYLRNPDSGYGTLVYPSARECPDTREWWMPERMLFCSIDPGIEDLCALVWWQTHFPEGRKCIRFLDSYTNNKLPVQFYAHLLTGIMPEPEDDAWLYRDLLRQPAQRYIMDWMARVPASAQRHWGDPAAKQTESSMSSFQQMLNLESLRLRQRAGQEPAIPVHLMIPREIIHKRNNLHDRRNAMREALTHCEFSTTDGAQSFKEALYSVRFQEMTEKTTRPPGTLHDRFSHQVTAGEFGMVYEELRLTDSEVAPVKQHQIGRIQTLPGAKGSRGSKNNRFTPYPEARQAATLVGI